ncbi:hypothetical protein II906_02540 [bacterium]|nr:hypothetical protein [bacterium]
MSFGINGPDSNMPAIQKSHHTNDGGAGNLGYFQQQKKQKDEEKEQEADVFQSSSGKSGDELSMEELESLSDKVKGFLRSMLNRKEEKKPEDK